MQLLALAAVIGAAPAAPRRSCPKYEAIANLRNPLIANFSVETFLGHWVEIKSHNVPGLTTGCSCTRYNCAPPSHRRRRPHLPCAERPPADLCLHAGRG